MKWKDEKDQQDFVQIDGPYKSEENLMLREFIEILEQISVMTGHGEITITDYLRDNPRSLHHYGKALDGRVNDKPLRWHVAMAKIGEALAILNPQFRMNPHFDDRKTQPHIHIEIRRKK